MAYARAIWTYDSTTHTFDEWQDAVSVFANPSGEAPRIARSMLPYLEQWQQLALHRGSATVTNITASSTPELRALERDPRAPPAGTVFWSTDNRRASSTGNHRQRPAR
jgi:hypothetical protein